MRCEELVPIFHCVKFAKCKILIIQYNNSIGNNNNKVNEMYSLFLKFSALGLLQDVRNNFHSYCSTTTSKA